MYININNKHFFTSKKKILKFVIVHCYKLKFLILELILYNHKRKELN